MGKKKIIRPKLTITGHRQRETRQSQTLHVVQQITEGRQ